MPAEVTDMGRGVRGWGMGLLILLVLGGQAYSLFAPDQRAYVLGLTMLVLDIVGLVSGLRAAKRGRATLWRTIALGRLCAIITFVVLLIEGLTQTHVLWWVGISVRLGAFC